MNIILNNNKEVIAAETLTVAELLKIKNYNFKLLIVRINGELVEKENYDSAIVKEGDDVIVFHLICGG